MFATVSTIKNRKLKKSEDEIRWVKNLYLQSGFKITHIQADSEFEPLGAEMYNIDIYLNCASKKEHITESEQFNYTVK